ncbi:sigma-54-dependent Fis family transcriptional regulator [Candidatus Aerophobetes bacterium]|mgnify:CR=1 FL=1|uniref:Sigma-54-dependent Fis family transcriptional regulator n=1 Tax=Aerophobetes bacterium TaxID=2030807 RepID=A0A497E6X4_UNCAE|nr:MAG: sigma-54-dependent Fis family transcriptional regulator [Candidatus Aerophobetes bacterium]
MAIEKILVVDDEPLVRNFLKEVLEAEDYEVLTTEDGLSALKEVERGGIDLVITDVRMPKMNGIELLKEVKKRSPSTLVVVITAYGTIENAVEAMKNGACDYITKPLSPEQIKLAIQKASQHKNLLNENRYLRSEVSQRYNFEQLIGRSPQMRRVYEMIDRVAPTNATVLIQGESGTGKELVARAIHYRSPRKDKPFVKVNCAALPEDLLESELFGHERGAFTGAVSKREGRFELADRGTLLLDEISETSPAFQAKLLRVLQEQEFERVGGSKTIKVDVRVIATTNKDLKQAIREGKFREDLYYRLNVLPIYLPPLRERKEDIPLLVQHFLEKYSRQNGLRIKSLSKKCLDMMMQYEWPGNVRELENVIERAVVMSEGETIFPENISLSSPVQKMGLSFPEEITLEEMEKRLILHTLQRTGGNRTEAAKILGISVRTVRNKLKKYGM